MFHSLQLEVMERFTAVEKHFIDARKLRGDSHQTAKGLVFIQIYAIHEYTVHSVVRLAAQAIAAHSPTYADLSPSLLALFLDPELASLRDVPARKVWDSRLALLDRATSTDRIAPLTGAPLPVDGSHFRQSHIKLILKVLGIRRALTLRKRHLYKIDEVVNHRNSIAHGEETAASIGRRYSREEIRTAIKVMRLVCLRLIFLVDDHCQTPTRHCR